MITRRKFIVTTAATASSPFAAEASAEQSECLPLKALPRVRTVFAKRADEGRLVLFSDGPETPQKLIRSDVLERAFGPGTDLLLQQRDHWRMIDEGWFAEDELFEPTCIEDPAFQTWHANYRPETEAHDFLYDLFRDEIAGPFGARIPDLGLELGEHPTTPRYATAKLDGEWCIPLITSAVAARTTWLAIDTNIAP
ncbi:hypothetical protein AB2B41_19655 [Marimonas sp. MJW-29]|uniref:Uncharacterized protein n=1 Tax=Sulfitobacter sediminis TaxID=3234186 RepID=A0ABV3RS94_9RHOB